MLAYQILSFLSAEIEKCDDMPLAQYSKLACTMSVGKGEKCCCGFVKSVLTHSF